MFTRQNIYLTLTTALETYLFNTAIFQKSYFFAVFFGFILVKKLYTSFIITRLLKMADKLTKK